MLRIFGNENEEYTDIGGKIIFRKVLLDKV
jgi:hypothetical protein